MPELHDRVLRQLRRPLKVATQTTILPACVIFILTEVTYVNCLFTVQVSALLDEVGAKVFLAGSTVTLISTAY